MMKLSVVDQARMSYGEQLKLIRSANVLVGVHGAGLMFIMFAAEEAVLVEVHPSYRQDRHFRHAAKMTDKLYMPVRSLSRESCQGSSDNVMVPAGEFALAMDGTHTRTRTHTHYLIHILANLLTHTLTHTHTYIHTLSPRPIVQPPTRRTEGRAILRCGPKRVRPALPGSGAGHRPPPRPVLRDPW